MGKDRKRQSGKPENRLVWFLRFGSCALNKLQGKFVCNCRYYCLCKEKYIRILPKRKEEKVGRTENKKGEKLSCGILLD